MPHEIIVDEEEFKKIKSDNKINELASQTPAGKEIGDEINAIMNIHYVLQRRLIVVETADHAVHFYNMYVMLSQEAG
jgi:hypothetical protein